MVKTRFLQERCGGTLDKFFAISQPYKLFYTATPKAVNSKIKEFLWQMIDAQIPGDVYEKDYEYCIYDNTINQ